MNISTLDLLNCGETAVIVGNNADGALLRRLRDLGFVPGEEITALFKGVSGSPAAFRVCGSVIALRTDTCRLISVERPA